jgi:hypothetical protein
MLLGYVMNERKKATFRYKQISPKLKDLKFTGFKNEYEYKCSSKHA